MCVEINKMYVEDVEKPRAEISQFSFCGWLSFKTSGLQSTNTFFGWLQPYKILSPYKEKLKLYSKTNVIWQKWTNV